MFVAENQLGSECKKKRFYVYEAENEIHLGGRKSDLVTY